MDCTRFGELAFDYLENRLSSLETGDLQAHMGACGKCVATMRAIEENERILTDARVPSAPDTLWPRIQAALPPALPVRRRSRAGGLVAAAAIVLVFFGVVVGLQPATQELDLEVVEVKGEVSQSLSGLIPGFEEPSGGARVAGTLLGPGR